MRRVRLYPWAFPTISSPHHHMLALGTIILQSSVSPPPPDRDTHTQVLSFSVSLSMRYSSCFDFEVTAFSSPLYFVSECLWCTNSVHSSSNAGCLCLILPPLSVQERWVHNLQVVKCHFPCLQPLFWAPTPPVSLLGIAFNCANNLASAHQLCTYSLLPLRGCGNY